MRRNRLSIRTVCLAAILAGILGCCSKPSAGQVTHSEVAKEKLQLMRQLADAVERDPDSSEAMAAFEEFRNLPISARENPQELTEIVQIYRARVKGKARGPMAEELSIVMMSLETNAKASK